MIEKIQSLLGDEGTIEILRKAPQQRLVIHLEQTTTRCLVDNLVRKPGLWEFLCKLYYRKTWEMIAADRLRKMEKVLPAFRVLEDRSLTHDAMRDHRCYQYVFRERLGEPWSDEKCQWVMNRDCEKLLARRGYKSTVQPQSNNVVAYGHAKSSNEIPDSFNHVGLLCENGLVHSKIGSIPLIIEHRVQDIPSFFGDTATIFEKSSGAARGEHPRK